MVDIMSGVLPHYQAGAFLKTRKAFNFAKWTFDDFTLRGREISKRDGDINVQMKTYASGMPRIPISHARRAQPAAELHERSTPTLRHPTRHDARSCHRHAHVCACLRECCGCC